MERIGKFLRDREEKRLLRVLRPARFRKEGKIYFKDKSFIDFSSNDYLGLSGHPKIKEAAEKSITALGTSSSASRLLSGDLNIHHELEKRIASFKEKEDALLFNSGYQANVGIISSLLRKGDAVFSDKLNHASIIDGMLLSGAKIFRFRHNDTEHLEFLLKSQRNNYKDSLIVTETVFSMEGDKPPLGELVFLKEKYSSMLLVDEAHATGVFGEKGKGVVEEAGMAGRIELIMGTFGKAMGSFGAYVACSSELKKYFVNSARSFIYSTSLPPSIIGANLAGLDLIEEEPFRRSTLLRNSDYFRQELGKRGFSARGTSQIVPLIFGDSEKAAKISRDLQKEGYWVLPIRPPTIPEGEARLRFSLTYHHTKDMLEKLIDDISKVSHV
ncbi:MAG: 8-amino-7-oxononanoate synthase [Candidatus Omnitrophota bacterium]|nr:MAG: 8-amino-7-oxononanoate synthase [Candidatus Omnitrophota bacterium]